MKKRREMIENKTTITHKYYMDACNIIQNKAMEYIRKHNFDEIRETIEACKSLKRSEELCVLLIQGITR